MISYKIIISIARGPLKSRLLQLKGCWSNLNLRQLFSYQTKTRCWISCVCVAASSIALVLVVRVSVFSSCLSIRNVSLSSFDIGLFERDTLTENLWQKFPRPNLWPPLRFIWSCFHPLNMQIGFGNWAPTHQTSWQNRKFNIYFVNILYISDKPRLNISLNLFPLTEWT